MNPSVNPSVNDSVAVLDEAARRTAWYLENVLSAAPIPSEVFAVLKHLLRVQADTANDLARAWRAETDATTALNQIADRFNRMSSEIERLEATPSFG